MLAGYMSSLMPLVVVLCAPIAGLILDRWGRQLYVLLTANVITIFAYFLLIQVIFLGRGLLVFRMLRKRFYASSRAWGGLLLLCSREFLFLLPPFFVFLSLFFQVLWAD